MISDHRCTILFWSWTNWLRWDQRRTKVLVATEGGSDEKHQAQRSPNAKLDQHLIQFPTIKRMLGAVFFFTKKRIGHSHLGLPHQTQTDLKLPEGDILLFICLLPCLSTLFVNICRDINCLWVFRLAAFLGTKQQQ